MQTPNNLAGNLTEQIMARIKEHIIKQPPPQENHDYNRVYEAIYDVLTSGIGSHQ